MVFLNSIFSRIHNLCGFISAVYSLLVLLFFSDYSRRFIYLFLKLALFCSVHRYSFLSCFSLWLLLHRSLHFSIHSTQWRSYSTILHTVLWPAFLPVLDLRSAFQAHYIPMAHFPAFLRLGKFSLWQNELVKSLPGQNPQSFVCIFAHTLLFLYSVKQEEFG